MAKESVEALIEGGKATAAPPLGPALGPLKVNIGQVVAAINEKTKSFKGMQVPVKVIVDSDTKEFEIEVGTPPAAALIKKEAGVEKGSGNPLLDKVADLRIEQVIKIAKMKEDALIGKNLKSKVREIVGTCQSMGVLVEGMPAPEALKAIQEGKYDEQIKAEKTELTAEDLKALEEEKKKLQADLEKRRKELEAKAKELITLNKSKEPSKIKAALVEAKIPPAIIEKMMTEAGIVVTEKKEAAPKK
ncbi:50S ribosomal protein L11 [Candidatus Woesearchaeota archaeon]|nr:50S ribosomal protein L11 [Candidatus Woesearchaeota archaeon]MBW3014469.1 50S ribosomal protein L11 [Candidatus Woesearchaeota archaeon]